MAFLKVLSIFLYVLIGISEQLKFPTLPTVTGFQKLPTPTHFLEQLLNVPSAALNQVVKNFKFDEVLTENVRFLLYSKDETPRLFDFDSDKYVFENNSKPIKFVIHGWRSAGDYEFVKEMAKSYHSIGINHVIGVDWSLDANRSYLHSARGTKKVGEVVADFIINLTKNDTKSLRNIHLIGHSLGAHVSGFAGNYVQDITNGHKIGRITGLDVAAPLFEYPRKQPSDSRLTKDNAHYVDSIHTNLGFLGFRSPLAHADFYVNFGGPIQKGCVGINVFNSLVCSHSISHDFYNRTITSMDFLATYCKSFVRAVAKKCNDKKKVIMGEHNTNAHALAFLGYVRSRNIFRKMSETTLSIEESIKNKLKEQLAPLHLDVINESYMHNVPKGSETHFKVVVVSEKFNNLPLLKMHRLVNDALNYELQNGVHALSIIAKTPNQWQKAETIVESSPTCRGGFGK